MTNMPRPIVAQLAPIVFVFLWSTGFIGTRMGSPFSEPMTFLTIRFGVVLAILVVLVVMLGAKWPSRMQALHAFISGFMIHGLYLGCVFWSIDDGMPAGLAALVMGLQPVLTAFFARGLLHEKITRNHIIGFILGLIGIAIVIYPRLQGGAFSITPMQILVSFGAVISISLGTVYQKRFASNLDMRAATVLQYLAALLFCGTLSLLMETQTIIWSGEFLFALGWLVLVLSIGAVFLLLWLIEQGAVSNTAALFYLVPAVTAVISYFLFDEPITFLQVIGMMITATGVFLASRQRPA